jgi:broad specificity phosphatase PhoE
MTNPPTTHKEADQQAPHGDPAGIAPPPPETAAEAADRIGRLLDEIDAGNVSASAVERAFLAGAVYGLKLAAGN